MTAGPLTCRLCGSTWNVAPALIRWATPEPYTVQLRDGTTETRERLWSWGPRCRDADSCRARVELAGVEWLLT